MPNPARSIRMRFWLGIMILAIAPMTAQADEKPGDVMIDNYLAQEAARLSERFLDGARTLDEWQAKRPRLQQEYLDMLGLSPLPKKTPLHATVTGKLERDHFVIEKLHFQSRPGLYVTGNLYRPKDSAGKLPTVLYVCGHSGRGRDGNKTAFQDHGMWFATHGYVCLIIDTLQLGEIPGIHHGTYREGRWWWQARGYTPAGVECWNGIRAIDYLITRPDVDPDRLAVTGISGGGAATFWIAAADERVRCAVPVSGMSDLESYVTHKVINGHCDCMFLINSHRWEWTTIAALIAPRPLLFCNSDKDPIFPMDGNERITARLRKLYAMYGKPELVDTHISHGGHDYRPDLRIAVFQWINSHLKNDTGPVDDANFAPIPGKELRVFPEDADIPRDAINGKIDETFVPLATAGLPEEGKFEPWRRDLLAGLLSFPRFPEQQRRKFFETNPMSLVTEANIEVPVWAPQGIANSDPTLVVLGPDEKPAEVPEWARTISPNPRLVLAPRGNQAAAWTENSPPNYVRRAHALLGHTVDQGRVWDIVVALRTFEKPKTGWRVVGRGQAGILAAYAALFEPSVTEIVVADPPRSHREGPIFLNILRVLDIPDALGLLAPRRLALINARDSVFDRTAQIYKAAGAQSMLERK
jgi:dienelactone hydrolase